MKNYRISKRDKQIDEYFEKQPPRDFIDGLKKHEARIINRRELSEFGEGYVMPDGCFIDTRDCTELKDSRLLDEFQVFLKENAIWGNEYPITIKTDAELLPHEYTIAVKKTACSLTAADLQALVSAVIRLEDELLSGGGILKCGEYEGHCALPYRVTRCFFSPTNRPPKNGDELLDDIDYYPEEYLERLAYCGVNGIWIYTDFNSLLTSSYIVEYGREGEKRLAKLNRVIDKCEKYGIDVYIFAMEPMSLTNGSISSKLPGLIKKYPQLAGNRRYKEIAFCSRSSFGKKYLKEAIAKLIAAAPKLKGLISITQGERITSCATTPPDLELGWENTCPRCKKYSMAENLAYTVSLIRKYISEIKPEFKYVSWTYGHRFWSIPEITEYAEKSSNDISLMQNFEEGGNPIQLGKPRHAVDYWLSYIGPSERYSATARVAKKKKQEMWAKMQICCSHELATVPYIPAPGLIYDKITKALKLGLSGVMESWYFGNYPSVMSKAVGVLSYKSFSDKREFLKYLSSLYYKNEAADDVVSAWCSFERAYKNYPVNTMFSYYGPMHDGVVWELSLLPKNYSLPRTWQLIDIPDGDRIGECLFSGHTICEALTLAERIVKGWRRGVRSLEAAAEKDAAVGEQLSIAKTLLILFESGRNILKFYKLRGELGYETGDSEKILSEMRSIVKKEIQNSERMIPLCEADNRVGYHSEAEGFKFFPEKLKARIEKLNLLLKTDFPYVKKRIKSGLAPLEYYLGIGDDVNKYSVSSGKFEKIGDGSASFKITDEGEEIHIELKSKKRRDFFLCSEFELMFPKAPLIIKPHGEVVLHIDAFSLESYFGDKITDEIAKWRIESLAKNEHKTHVLIKVSKKEAGFIRFPYKMLIKTLDGEKWCTEENPVLTLGKCEDSPGEFGWITK